MPYIDAVIFTKFVLDGEGNPVFHAISDIFTWAIANDENLPHDPTCYGKCTDLTGQTGGPAMKQRILDNLAIFCAKLEITTATAAQFVADARIWTLGYKRYNDDGEEMFSNWGDSLTAGERQQAATYVTTNSAITAQQLAAAFDPSDTRLEIARKLKAFFRDI